MVTLYAYILRELLKVFVLTSIGLTVLFTMGGGIYNVMRYEGVTTGGMLQVLPWSLTIFLTLTMPVAALFAATIVYGRLTADNELLACRAAGINVHKLFRPALLLAMLVFLFTFLFGNYVIPDLIGQINRFLRANLRDIAAQQLNLKGYVRVGTRFFMTAEAAENPSAQMLEGFPTGSGVSYLLVHSPALMELRNDKVVRFTTAEAGLCQFDARDTPIKATVYVRNARDYEAGKQAVQVTQQTIGPIPSPWQVPMKKSWADLGLLLRWRTEPWRADEVQEKIRDFLVQFFQQSFYRDCAQRFHNGQTLTLLDEKGRRYDISAAGCTLGPDGRPALSQARVTVAPDAANPLGETWYEAGAARLVLRPQSSSGQMWVEARLEPPVFESRAGDPRTRREKPTVNLEGLLPPEELRKRIEAFTPATVLSPEDAAPFEAAGMEDKRAGLRAAVATFQRDIRSLIHFRLGLTASVFVMIVMGAALGVIFRGAQALTAFGLACVPFGCVIILMLMGRQLGGNEHTAAATPFVIWGGLGLVAVADAALLRFGVRR